MTIENKVTELLHKQYQLKSLKSEVAKLECDIASELSQKDEGSTTKLFGNAKLTITNKMNRSVDQSAIKHLQMVIPEDEFDVLFPKKYQLSVSAYRDLSEQQKKIIAPAITAKPAKPSVKIEVVEDGV